MKRGQRIDADRVLHLYDVQSWTIRRIAAELGCSYGGVYRIVSTYTTLRPRRQRDVWSPGDREIAVVTTLTDLAGSAGWCTVSRDELATLLGITVPTLRQSLKWLEAYGYVRCDARRGRYLPGRPGHAGASGERLSSRYTVLRMPSTSDVHHLGVAVPAPGGGR